MVQAHIGLFLPTTLDPLTEFFSCSDFLQVCGNPIPRMALCGEDAGCPIYRIVPWASCSAPLRHHTPVRLQSSHLNRPFSNRTQSLDSCTRPPQMTLYRVNCWNLPLVRHTLPTRDIWHVPVEDLLYSLRTLEEPEVVLPVTECILRITPSADKRDVSSPLAPLTSSCL